MGRWTVRLTVVTAFICCVLLVSPPQVWAVADPVTPHKRRIVTYLTCLAALALVLTIGIIGGGHD
ncbi:hypothetical protein ACFVJH_00085 [Streptomyces decoyicus]|uniref:hypothetical protein n=1 Tax=Streptomyces decoyicus TaxID=249567 RepID=UPI003641EB7A